MALIKFFLDFLPLLDLWKCFLLVYLSHYVPRKLKSQDSLELKSCLKRRRKFNLSERFQSKLKLVEISLFASNFLKEI